MDEREKIAAISRCILDGIERGDISTMRRLDFEKRRLSRENNLGRILRNSEILSSAREDELELVRMLVKKPVRSISGISVVAVMTKPAPCPGECIYCPQGENAPKSYTGLEPAARRARMFDYDPYRQAENRLRQLKDIGHSVDKIELIIMGGTFLSCAEEYQDWFVKRCFDALNGADSLTLDAAKKLNECAKSRCVGLTIETRPDYCRQEHVDRMLELGATRVELGVQTLSDEVYGKVRRGHTLKDVIDATRVLKDSSLKVVYHMMPGLFKSESEDVSMFRELFENPDYRPDMLKIYPVLVIRGTRLYELYRHGNYAPLTNESAKVLVAKIMGELPKYVRVMRCQRDIPIEKIAAGPTAGNLREMAEGELARSGGACKCIRCHEAGHLYYKNGLIPRDVEIGRLSYGASSGREYFLSLEDKEQGIIVGFLRLRMPSAEPRRKEIDGRTALIRELKVFGASLELNSRKRESFQHRGAGKRLVLEAEKIARDEGAKKILVIAAVGTREYYRKLGYVEDGPYFSKMI